MSAFTDKVVAKIHRLREESGLTWQELGERLGYPPEKARKAAWQFFYHKMNPRLDLLERVSLAFGLHPSELLDVEYPKARKRK